MSIPEKAKDRLDTFYMKVRKIAQEQYSYSSNKENTRYKCIERNALGYEGKDYLGGAWFGYIRPEEPTGGVYSDFSLVFFPDIEGKYCIISLGIGSEGLNNDRELAVSPATRRLFNRIRLPQKDSSDDAPFYYKTSFDDDHIPCPIVDAVKEKGEYQWLVDIVSNYDDKLPAAQIIKLPENLDDLENMGNPQRKYINAWLACYAKFRGWGTKATKPKIEKAIQEIEKQKEIINDDDIWNVLEQERFVVLQGAPGTGKTYTATNIASKHFDNDNVIFEQFHAETTYSDFVYGIRPRLDRDDSENDIKFVETEGTLLRAINRAQEVKKNNQNVLLIIDEINRANLSNVLGPVFYLFEKNYSNRSYNIKIGEKEFIELPSNLYVIATMNTADRSLAVVDFALRRRFTWITLRPKVLDNTTLEKDGLFFHEDAFRFFEDVFFKHATDDELNLQPGHSYFITKNASNKDKLMAQRLRYEIMPLIKEYLNEGFLQSAKDDFENYFYNTIGTLLYE
ncbi:MAG: AAA family ATPase [Muribaculaceae bacterium]|nr:AAA family ATPase [Muribaculaceae bacterium]